MKLNEKLTPNFSLHEFIVSDTAKRIGNSNMPNNHELSKLKILAIQMEIVRVILGGKYITITSAFRNSIVNKAVGGVNNSDHRKAKAVDFRRHGLSSRRMCQLIERSALVYDQLLDYGNGRIHLGFGSRKRRQGYRVKGKRYIPIKFA